ncbi:Esterase/lipase superfamily enzyme [Lutimaribacter saemankumensis]|uniref:Esterase/lipase superfamily enzyme n=2 Tax=Lutimaribacter saemankumensis TaxID=490829 RepID=A0A1G8TK45_9RHOB|nr:Esterase/lipase superfamily enzyme [Lutimaribacter saemankumensis]
MFLGVSDVRFKACVLLLVTSLAIAGCAPAERGMIGLAAEPQNDDADSILKKHEIFVITSRARDNDPTILFSGKRSPEIGLAKLSVSVPPNHKPGEIEFPRSGIPSPAKHFTVIDPAVFGSEGNFISALQAELNQRPAHNRNVLVFVHGYNTTLTEAALRMGQFVEDSGYEGVPVLFSWASSGRLLDYVYDMNSVLIARDNLLRGAYLISKTNAKAVDLLSHSMGNLLTVEAMRQAKLDGTFNRTGRLRHIIMAAPDIDADLFRQQLAPFADNERQFYILISRDDNALSFSRFLARGVPRVGNDDVEDLTGLGVTILDLSEIDVNGSNHSKFSDSPEVVQLIGKRLSVDGLGNKNASGSLLSSVLMLPIKVTAATLSQ